MHIQSLCPFINLSTYLHDIPLSAHELRMRRGHNAHSSHISTFRIVKVMNTFSGGNSIKIVQPHSENRIYIKGKNLLAWGINSFLLE